MVLPFCFSQQLESQIAVGDAQARNGSCKQERSSHPDLLAFALLPSVIPKILLSCRVNKIDEQPFYRLTEISGKKTHEEIFLSLSGDSPPRVQPRAYDGSHAARGQLSDGAKLAFKLRKRLLEDAAIVFETTSWYRNKHGSEKPDFS